jgi:CheY-like chemotaxis protein
MLPYKIQIDLVNSGVAAIEAVQANDYDVVFMDHRMPGMDGVEALRHIRTLNGSRFAALPVIALTANVVDGVDEMFLKNGFNEFLSKPIDVVKLNFVLEKWIPARKQKSLSKQPDVRSRVVSISGDNSDSSLVIEGINVEKGISISAGSLDYYMETLATFLEDGSERIKMLRECITKKDLTLYTTYVHALKSAAASIGAEDLAVFASFLETAGKQESLSLIKTRNDDFIDELESLLDRIRNALAVHRKNEDETGDCESFYALLSILVKALEDMDAGVINQTLSDLQKNACSEKFKDSVRNLSAKVLMSEYDEAAEYIKEMLTSR